MSEALDDAAVHLKQAALEFISAARALLDIAEEAVREPAAMTAVIVDALSGFVASSGPSATPPPRVEHIDVS